MRDDNYYTITGWMLNQLGLSGTELNIFAIIHGFTQNPELWYDGSLSYMSESVGASKSTIQRALKSLEDKGLIEKGQTEFQNVVFSKYRSNVVFEGGMVKMNRGYGQNDQGGMVKMTTNNKRDKNRDISPLNTKVFCPPTVDEVRSYLHEKGITGIDPEQFVDYYQSNGWKVGRTKMQDWKAAVRTWTRNRTSNSGNNRNVRNNHVSSNAKIDSWIKSLKDNPDYKGGADVTNLL